MSQGKYSGRLKGYSLITLKKSRPMAHDIMVSIQKIQGQKKILSLNFIFLLRHTCSLKYVVYFPSNSNKMNKM